MFSTIRDEWFTVFMLEMMADTSAVPLLTAASVSIDADNAFTTSLTGASG